MSKGRSYKGVGSQKSNRRRSALNRRQILLTAAALVVSGQAPTPAQLLGAGGDAYFTDWLDGFYVRALAAGVTRPILDLALSGLAPDPRVIAADSRQPEFAKPVGDYVRGAVTQGRADLGRAKARGVAQLPAIDARFGVPSAILIAIWAMESGYGVNQGDLDVIRSLATLAASGRRRPWAEGELLACLTIIGSGEASRARLRGSWAGAMGQTQMLPSTYFSTAVDGDGDGRRDIWTSAPDALASAANLLVKGGWRRGEGWAREVILPLGFDYGLSEGPEQKPEQWRAVGARRADGLPWNATDRDAPWTLLLPSGAQGPAFLAGPNHYAIRKYNNSVAYALSVGLLADRVAGGSGLVTPWPHETPLSLTDRLAAQQALAAKGFNPGTIDGIAGLGTRQALRAWQRSQGLPADGYLSPDVIRRLMAD
jgi:membrane-bound lytic murein transglycosylase B